MGAVWTWEIVTGAGVTIAELTTATGRQIAYRRNSFSEATCALSCEDADAVLLGAALAEGWPRLRCWRRAEGAIAATLAFYGHMAPLQLSAEVDSTLLLTAQSPFGRLLGGAQGNGRFLTDPLTYVGADAGGAAAGLLAFANAEGATGLVAGSVQTTVTRDISWPAGQMVGEGIMNLSNMLNGFDFIERFDPAPAGSMAALDIYASLGVDREHVRFEHGHTTLANVRAVGETIAPPVNHVLLTGADGLIAQAQDIASKLKYGTWMLRHSFSTISVQSTLDARALSMLRPAPIRTVSLTPESNAPRPFDDFGMGDTVGIYADRGLIQVDARARVNAFSVLIDDEGNESSEIPDPRTPEEDSALRATLEVEVPADV